MERPSDREIDKAIKKAKEALKQGPGMFANFAKAVGELYTLEIEKTENVWELIKELLNEVTLNDYVGGRPPQRSYEKTIEGKELFAFSWQSHKMRKQMYLKFALKEQRFYYVSLHASKERVV